MYDTLSDIGIWLDIWSELEGGVYLGETNWLKRHLSMNLFKLGRLQFAFGKAERDIIDKNIKYGDNVIKIHIPSDGPLLREECERSVETAKRFFAKFYPDYEYKCFTCHSWLMDTSLKEFLRPESNILKFQDMFEVFEPEESYEILRYVFKWNTTKENINSYVSTSNFAQKVKARINDNKNSIRRWELLVL